MNPTVFYVAGGLAAAAPFLAMVVILVHYYLRRAAWKRAKRAGRKLPGFCPSSSSLGSAFQIVQVFYRPTTAFVIEAKLEEDADENDNGDPESPAKHLLRQLRRIRRGEMVETLVVRRQ